jgi:hypothetical protein
MTASAEAPHLGLIVEGDGDSRSIPLLLRKYLLEKEEYRDLLGKPINAKGRGNVTTEGGIEKFVQVAANRPGCQAVLVFLDSEFDPICPLGPQLLARALSVCTKQVAVCMAEPMFEGWIVASAETMGLPGLTYEPSKHPSGLIQAQMEKYVKPIDQPKLASRIDIAIARARSKSLDRSLTKLDTFLSLLS